MSSFLRFPMTIRSLTAPALLASLLGLAACGGDTFDPPNQVKGVRVLAVKKSAAYAAPGEKVRLDILYWDGKSKPSEQREVEVTWFAGCTNPAGDLYYGCYPQLADLFEGTMSADKLKLIGTGSTFEVTIPSDIVSSRPPRPDGSTPYGLSYVFFAACPGKLGPPKPGKEAESGLPVGCYDENGDALGPDDFVAGYTSIYAYDELRNQNPVMHALQFEGNENEVRVPRCTGSPCRSYTLKALIDPSSAELDPLADPAPDGSPIQEQIWLNYYATAGTLSHPAALVNDAIRGWNDRNESGWEPPREPGTVMIWAVVRDNRGGVDWKRVKVVVE